ncbi:MAG: nucleotide exchange factor GrpE [Glaciecola sp.]
MNQDNADNNEQQETAESVEQQEVSNDATIDANEAAEPGIDYKAYSEELDAKLTEAEAIIEGQKDAVLRAKADGENARRRAEQEVDKARKFALEKFAGELLNVVDNLERATQAADAENEAVKSLLEGVELTHKSFISTFEKFGLEILDPQGEAFNPEHHQAMSMQESDDVAPNTVIAVMQKGYLLSGRLLRPAMVMVSRASSNGVDTQA